MLKDVAQKVIKAPERLHALLSHLPCTFSPFSDHTPGAVVEFSSHHVQACVRCFVALAETSNEQAAYCIHSSHNEMQNMVSRSATTEVYSGDTSGFGRGNTIIRFEGYKLQDDQGDLGSAFGPC